MACASCASTHKDIPQQINLRVFDKGKFSDVYCKASLLTTARRKAGSPGGEEVEGSQKYF